MKRWGLRRYVAATVRLRKLADRIVDRLTAGRPAGSVEAGQTSIEYLGIAVVIVVIIGVLAGTTDIGRAIKDAIVSEIGKVTGG